MSNDIGDIEREMRIQLAACYRLTSHFGMDDQIDTHISVQIPGTNHFLMNPYGHLFSEMKASALVKIDANGEPLAPSMPRVNRAGFVIHSAVHLARPDITCVFHTHTQAGVAISCLADGLLPLTQFSLRFYDRISYHAYDGISLDEHEGQALVRDLGAGHAMILHNHGLLTVGRSIPEAFWLMYYLDQACQAQLKVMSTGAKMVIPPADVCRKTGNHYDIGRSTDWGQRAWPALLRLLDSEDPSYKD